jgi:hypothetical protein
MARLPWTPIPALSAALAFPRARSALFRSKYLKLRGKTGLFFRACFAALSNGTLSIFIYSRAPVISALIYSLEQNLGFSYLFYCPHTLTAIQAMPKKTARAFVIASISASSSLPNTSPHFSRGTVIALSTIT